MYPPRTHGPTRLNWKTLAVISVVVFVLLVVVPRTGFWPLLFFLWLGVPALQRLLNSLTEASTQGRSRPAPDEESEHWAGHSGRRYHAPSAYQEYEDEKPKRRTEYVVGDDGELVEVTRDDVDDKPKRQSSGRDEYV